MEENIIKIDMNDYEILIFDLDDTLIDNTENVRYAYVKMMKAVGKDYSESGFERWLEVDKKFWQDRQNGLIEVPDDLKHEVGKKSERYLSWLRAQRFLIYFNNEISLDEAMELNRLFTEALKENVVAIDGANEVLRYLSGKYSIVVATNGPKVAAKDKLAKIGCLDYVSRVLSADMFGYSKPKKEFFEAIQKETGNYDNNAYLVIGNSLGTDVEFAMNSGCDSCWLDRGDEVLGEYRPTFIIKSLRELKEIFSPPARTHAAAPPTPSASAPSPAAPRLSIRQFLPRPFHRLLP